MASTGKNSGLLNEDKLKPEMEALAAKILRENKNIKKVEVKAEIKVKTAAGEKLEAGKMGPIGGPENMGGLGRPGSLGPIGGQPEKASGGEHNGKNKGGDGEDQPKKESDKRESGGKKPGGQESEAKEEAENQDEGESGKNKEQPGQESNKEKPAEKPKEQEAGGKQEGGEKEGEEGGKGEKKTGEESEKGEKEGGKEAGEKKGGEREDEKGEKGEKETQSDKDSRILNPEQKDQAAGSTLAPEKEGQAASQLREEKRSSSAMEQTALDQVDSSGQRQQMGETGSLREWAGAVRQATNIKRQVEDLKAKAKDKIKDAVAAPIKQATSKLLQQSWLNLIDSFGATLIWINMHVFLRWTVSDKLFCKLGEEWLPKQVTQAGGEAAEKASTGLHWIEIVVLLILDLIILAVILGVLALIVMIVNFMGKSWWGKLGDLWDAFWGLGWGGISALVKLFSSIK